MDNIPPLPPPGQPSTPQIRSRITVVCAECKRLKLKCDRRIPCGSCTKRDTVSRCIYSPAAAEKVDLHSLNNRLIQVEATLSLITSGQTPPMFQSSYPFSQIPTTNPSSQSSSSANDPPSSSRPKPQHHFHHHLAPPGTTNTFISIPPHDLASLWLDELERDDSPPLELKLPSNSSSALNETNPVKLEAGPDPDLPCPGAPKANLSMHSQNMEIHLHLPTLDVYYPFPSSPDSQVQPLPYATSSSYVPPQVSNSGNGTAGRPYVTPALVARLPSFTRAKQLLQSSAHLLSARSVPLPACLLSSLSEESGRDERENGKGKGKACSSLLGTRWDAFECRALCLIGSRGLGAGTSSVMSDRKKREKVGARAREIFFGSGATSTAGMESLARHQVESEAMKSESTKRDIEAERNGPGHTAKDRGESLPFFATVCIVLAMGAATSEAFEKGSQAQALVQSTGRERHETSEFFYALAQQSLDVWEKSMTSMSPSVSKDTSKIEAVNEDERLDYLIANLLVIGYQLFQSYLRIEVKGSEQKRTADLNRLLPSVAKMVNMARVFGLGKAQKSLHLKDEEPGGKSNLTEYLNDKKRGKREERRRRKEDLKRMIWWDIVSYELFISDALGHPSLLSSLPCSVKLPRCAGPPLSADEAGSDQEENWGGEGANDIIEVYHGACYRLTKITQMVKHKMLYPDCCCGYTLDQAAALEREIRRFLESLPPSLRFTVMDDESKEDAPQCPETDVPQRNVLRMQRCTLMIMVQRLTIMVYLPFLRQHSTSPLSSMNYMSVQPDDRNRSSGSTCNPVLHPIYHAAQNIIRASLQLGSCSGNQSHPRQVPPFLLSLYPVEKALLDAVVICTYMRSSHAPLFPGHTVADSAISGMRMLWDSTLGTECRAVLERLKKRFHITLGSPSAYGVKRKHEQITIQAIGSHDAEPSKYGGESSTNHPQRQLLTMQERRNATNNSAGGKRSGNTLSNVRDPETGQKDKKHAKKAHPYPSVGIRVRGKETPPFRKPKMGSSSSTSASNIRVDAHRQQGLELQSTLDLVATPMTEGQPPQLGSNMPAAPPIHEPVHRSRSCSLDQDLRRQHPQHDSPSIAPFIAQFKDRDGHLHMNNVAHVETYNHGYQQQDTHVNSVILTRSFEGGKEHEQQGASFSPAFLQGVSPITVASSPYSSSGHLTPASGSPYAASGNVVPVSVTSLGQAPQAVASHPPAPPSYAHGYYHMGPSNSFNAIPYNQTQGQENISYTGVRLDTAGEPSPSIVNGDPTGGMGMATTVPSPPVYEKARLTMFDVKPPMDMLVQQQMHHRQMLQHQTTYGVDQHQQDSISITEPVWTPQGAIPIDASQRFWDPPVEQFKYFHS